MVGRSQLIIQEAERRFPTRIKIAVPAGGFGKQLTDMHAWLDANCGAGNWEMTPASLRGVMNDAMAIYFLDTALANAFVARWCIGFRPEPRQGSFHIRGDHPPVRVPAAAHKTP